MDVNVKGVQELTRALENAPEQARKAVARGIFRATSLVFAESHLNAPYSPTMEEARAARKEKKKRARPASASVPLKRVSFFRRTPTGLLRKATAFTRAKPGGLWRAISMEVDKADLRGSVFVAANSEAGKYARRIHDEKGKKWFERGPGTVARGMRADEKFIERALLDNQENINTIMADEFRKAQL